MRQLLIASLTVLVLSCASATTELCDDTQIREFNDKFDEASLRRDFKTLEQALAPNFLWITFGGQTFDRSGTLRHWHEGDSRYTAYRSEDVIVRLHNGSAVVTGRLLREGRNSKRDLSGQFRYTRVYLCLASGPRLEVFQVTEEQR